MDCKGKGLLTTYWCETKADTASSVNSDKPTDLESDEHVQVDCLLQRLVDWNVDMFTGLLKDIVIQRKNTGKKPDGALNSIASDPLSRPIDEVTEILTFPSVTDFSNCDSSEAYISPIVLDQLRSFVESISALYPGNPFHNFEHCSHVAMSTKKLLDRIAANEMEIWSTVRVSDRLTRFSIIFAALIHDAGHPGVSNAQLVNEQSDLAQTYKDRSVAEQNSIDAAWALLMDPKFDELRSCIFASETELKRFRQILVNVVMATDLFDKDLKAMRESRWERAFNLTNSSQSKPTNDHFNRQASIVLELVIQASDVSHTMQHFEVYKKWNTSLLQEMHSAFESGRAPKDPLDGWYEGELWFFDNYVIPLAEKLRACGVFGVSCDEFLNYATDNRMEWELKGRDIVSAFREGLLLNESGKYTEI